MKDKKLKIILGSASIGRRRVLKEMGYKFKVMPADIDEKSIRFDDPEELTLALARAKAEKLLSKIKEPAILITSDQVGVCNGKILEKPKNEAEIRHFFDLYAKYPAETITAVVVINTKTNQCFEGVDIAKIEFKPVLKKDLDKVIKKGDIYYCSGAFEIDDPVLKKYIKNILGERESVVGLPKAMTENLIQMALLEIGN